jgi:NADH-quinone oxidoreductase subunit F
VETGCFGHCYAEPLVTIAALGQPAIVYNRVTPELAPFLIRNYLVGGDPCLEWALGAVEGNETIPAVALSPRFAGEIRRLLLVDNPHRLSFSDSDTLEESSLHPKSPFWLIHRL